MTASDLITLVVFAGLAATSFWSYYQLHTRKNYAVIPAGRLGAAGGPKFAGPFAFLYLVHGSLVAAAVIVYLILGTPVVPSVIVLVAYALYWLRRRMLLNAIDKASR
jgi:hypothetical protein